MSGSIALHILGYCDKLHTEQRREVSSMILKQPRPGQATYKEQLFLEVQRHVVEVDAVVWPDRAGS